MIGTLVFGLSVCLCDHDWHQVYTHFDIHVLWLLGVSSIILISSILVIDPMTLTLTFGSKMEPIRGHAMLQKDIVLLIK